MVVAVVGTGTGVGKTTTTVGLLRALRARGVAAVGWKPIETGGDADERALAEACGTGVPASFRAELAIAPALAAAVAPDLEAIAARARTIEAEVLVVETAGGLFSPVRSRETNAELLELLRPDAVVLVAANRLGVLHDVESCRRAAPALDVRVLVLTGGREDDLSRRSNAGFLRGTFRQVVELTSVGADASAVAAGLGL